jgi:3-methyladenine DNA glycosylase Tag
MIDYDTIYAHACERKGGAKALKQLLPKKVSKKKVAAIPDDRFLAEFTKKVFQSGFVWRVVEQKWDGFEELFWDFDVDKLLLMPDEMLERKAQDKKIIRNFRKVQTIRDNAMMIADTRRREGCSFGEFVANWPSTDVIGLWLYLKKHGSRLGGNTGPYALRSLGVDTFLLSQDVEGFLRLSGVIDTGITSKKALQASQDFFNDLQQQSGQSLAQLSRLISYSFGQNWVGVETAPD